MTRHSPESESDSEFKPEAGPAPSGVPGDPPSQGGTQEAAPQASVAGDPPPAAEGPLEALRRERDEIFARLQRVSADYQNYVKRQQAREPEAIALAKADVLKGLIPVLDHFERALQSAPTNEEARALNEGLRIVRDEFWKVLQREGLTRFEAAVGEPFDPHRLEAVMQQAAEGVEPGHVSMALQAGYAYQGRTLRAAKVAVAPAESN